MPPGSVYAITRHPLNKEKVHVGTIWGSYGSDDGGHTWPVTHDGPHGTQIRSLFWLGDDTLVAATFGSGAGKAAVASGVTSVAAGVSGMAGRFGGTRRSGDSVWRGARGEIGRFGRAGQ